MLRVKRKAYQKAIDAYLDGFEMAEPTLFAKDASFDAGSRASSRSFAMRSGKEFPPKRSESVIKKWKLNWMKPPDPVREDSFPVTTPS
jgi:hypothetical protein